MEQTLWLNEFGDVVDAAGRESFIDDEQTNDLNAGGEGDRSHAERVFNRLHIIQAGAK